MNSVEKYLSDVESRVYNKECFAYKLVGGRASNSDTTILFL